MIGKHRSWFGKDRRNMAQAFGELPESRLGIGAVWFIVKAALTLTSMGRKSLQSKRRRGLRRELACKFTEAVSMPAQVTESSHAGRGIILCSRG